MSNIPNYDKAQYSDGLLPAFTRVNQRQRAQAVNPNPAYKPPQRERPRTSIYDIPDLDNEQQKPRSNNGKRALAVLSTPMSLSQTSTPPDSTKQARKNSRPLQAKNTKDFLNATVSKPNFQQNFSHSNGSKTSSNASLGAPPVIAHTTTMQSGIAMTTMQKLAAFRYQPSSTGSVHKAVAPMIAAPSQDVPTKIGAMPLPATISSTERGAHTSGNESYQRGSFQRGSHSSSLPSAEAGGYGNDASDFSEAFLGSYPQADIHEPGLDMLIPQMGAGSTHNSEHNDLPLTDSGHSQTEPLALKWPTYEIVHATEPFMARTQGHILPDTSLDLSDESHTTGRSELKFDEWNVEYDGGLKSDDFRSLETEHSQQQEYVSLPLDMEAQTADLHGHMVSNVVDVDHCSGQATNPADDKMLDYGVFDDLTAESWNHMDYVATADGQNVTRTNHAIQTEHGRRDNVDEGSEYVDPGDSMMSEVKRETSVGHFAGSGNPVHSHDQMPNSELPPSTKDFAETHVQDSGPGQDIEDYFSALGELDDHDFENAEILSSGNRHEIETTGNREVPPKPVPEPADEDYHATFGDFTDEDFKDIEILAGNTGKGKSLRDQKIPTEPSHAFQVPKAQLDEYPLDEDEQAELNELRTSTHQAVQETREPPSSILRSEEDMRDMDIYDQTLKYSPVATSCVPETPERNNGSYRELHEPLSDPEDWEFLRFLRRPGDPLQSNTAPSLAMYTSVAAHNREHSSGILIQAESDDYSPLHPFARPPFPAAKVAARSPVTGLSSNMLLRTCFRIGEALSQASLCTRDNQDAFTELFARVTFSLREADGKKQNFQFGDIFHNKPPFISGVLEKYASSDLQKMESFELITVNKEKREDELGQMVRVLGRVKRAIQGRGYSMDIVNIRKTDWEEVRWTQRILSPLGT